ncbi:hypothetical protein JK361_06870 [Streptomyces sp. 5-8]|uniref:Uncharacterized protein n=1 Tax=Streptomyces musisoli TaxID=2802280 RepID=A0ABS1NW41_9ACTN|nr:hypothetical protein [Streptomyces musisoli]MBL1104330.1 hypothetical protein [Streptomyces musisoli]
MILQKRRSPLATRTPRLPHVRPADPHVRPADPPRRRHRLRAVTVLVLALAAIAGVAVLALPSDAGRRSGAPRPAAGAGAGHLRRTPADAWQHAARLDFAAWPPRGRRTGDAALLARALRAWTGPAWRGRRSVEPGVPAGGRGTSARLLFADDVDGRAVVLLQDGVHTVRYSEPLHGGRPELAAALTEGADVATAAAVVVARSPRSVRLLLAPWITTAAVRDLRAPAAAPRAVARDDDGVTEPVAVAPAGGPCRRVPAVQLHASPRNSEDHAFLLADLGGLVPARLTYLPDAQPGALPRPPREAAGEPGMGGWAASACRLAGLRGQGVRSVGRWVFAAQTLPERAGTATWVCIRADTWRGTGSAEYLFLAPGGTGARVLARDRDTAQCGGNGRNVLAYTEWRAPSGTAYLLAAGSRAVTRLEVAPPVRGTGGGRFLATPAPSGRPVLVTGRLPDGTRIDPPLSPGGP